MGNGVGVVKQGQLVKVNGRNEHSVKETSPSSPLTRVKKILNSPLTRRKGDPSVFGKQVDDAAYVSATSYFGVQLQTVLIRENSKVPTLVIDLCSDIERRGLDQEGLFRINGNAQQLESMRRACDLYGTWSIESVNDVMTVASFLKLYLRELPEALILTWHAQQLIDIFDATCVRTNEEFHADGVSVKELNEAKLILQEMSHSSWDLLSYLCCFLNRVAQMQHCNRMSALSLATVFGPNLFRFSTTENDLKFQVCANKIVAILIVHHKFLFCKNTAQEQANSAKSTASSNLPLISMPRASSLPNSKQEVEFDKAQQLFCQVSEDAATTSAAETYRSMSPFVLESEIASDSSTASPRLKNQENVVAMEKTISDRIFQHLFGESKDNTEIMTLNDDCIKHNKIESQEKSIDFEANKSCKAKAVDKNMGGKVEVKSSSQKHRKSLIGLAADKCPVERMTHILPHYKRPLGPKKRRLPSRNIQIRQLRTLGAQMQTGESDKSVMKIVIPPLDLSILHEHCDGSEPIRMDEELRGITLGMTQLLSADGTQALLSPRMSKFRQDHHRDPDIPPSPPIEQQYYALQTSLIEEDIKKTNRKIHICKKKIRNFEEEFEAAHGYKPSHTDKIIVPEIKKILLELSRARKELRRLKEDDENARPAFMNDQNEQRDQQVKETLKLIQARLEDKRIAGCRPVGLLGMSRDQVMEEKLCLQKALLQFEGLHGRPSTKSQREIMKPLYDRYRNVKRMLNKMTLPSDKIQDLQSVPEDYVVDFSVQGSDHSIMKMFNDPVDMRVDNFHHDKSPEGLSVIIFDGNLHEMTYLQLLEELKKAQNLKRKIRKNLRSFEDQFVAQHGRKAEVDDRIDHEQEYLEYKQVKSHLKLLDALIRKHQTH